MRRLSGLGVRLATSRVAPAAAAGSLCWRRQLGSLPGIPTDEHGEIRMSPHSRAMASGKRLPVVQTCCGRILDPNRIMEIIQVFRDPKWMQAIQRALQRDEDYMTHCREHGPPSLDLMEWKERNTFTSDEEFLLALSEEVKTNVAIALHFCCIIDAYTAIIEKRDREKTRLTAEGPERARGIADFERETSAPFGTTLTPA